MIRPENRQAAADAADLVDTLRQTIGRMAQARGARDALTASATVEHGRITVVVNASGSIVRTEYSDGIEELSYGQIARATVRAAQTAAAEVQLKKQELLAPFAALRANMPRLEERFTELAELRAQLPTQVRAPLTPPSERTESVDPRYGDAVRPHTGGHRFLDR
ncbi:hypothetical protein OHB26_21505 [Nocardia sp. NBC_01503]|uniref:hypothetical protein n=1 Tax=Nocardia sp. NBC_01503 TaxID=2975997 RepID=UPI002E7C1258|nr:hypothetical protein [Nocardia sp. NBC_01503]WTL29563.1 hypothetical protein OHB26_21505 [Nocardia sp. NBC_01503]